MTEDRTVTRFEGTQLIVETGNDREVYMRNSWWRRYWSPLLIAMEKYRQSRPRKCCSSSVNILS